MSFRIIPPVSTPGKDGTRYPGYTELTVSGKTYAICAVGEHVDRALIEHANPSGYF